jgi:signal transduction histidine kinase/CheY-like chemotaxis protein
MTGSAVRCLVLAPVTVLNVNDDPARRYVISRILRAAGFDVTEAATGREGLARVAADHPTVVVLDVRLPDIDGFEVCRRIKQDPAISMTPVLLSSAVLVEDTDRIKGLEHADGYLAEPAPPPVLTATVRALARMAQAEAERAELLAMQRMEQAASALVGVGRQLMATWDFETRTRIIASAVADVFRVRRVALHTLDEATGSLTCVAAVGDDDAASMVGKPLFVGQGLSGRVVLDRVPLATSDVLSEPGLDIPTWMRAVFRSDCRAWVSVPLIAEPDVLGALALGDTTGRVFRSDEVQLLEAFAGQAALALRNARFYEQLHASGERLEALSRRLLDVQESEQRRLARELHDEMGARISAVKMELQALGRRPEVRALAGDVARTVAAVEELLQRVRRVSLDLRPSLLDDYGLEAALRWYIDRQARAADLDIRIVSDVGDARFPPEIETACYRVAQAAVTNVIRHADARHAQLELRRDAHGLTLVARDDGKGFDVAAARLRAQRGESLGLLAMQERAALAGGAIEIESVVAHGTELRARFPLPAESPVTASGAASSRC